LSANWATGTSTLRKNGVVTSSQGGFLLSHGTIRAPDVAFTPHATHSTLTQQQLLSFQGAPFSPVFVVEVDDLTNQRKLDSLTKKINETYFPSGVQLAWFVNATHQLFFTFSSTTAGVVRRYSHQWLDEEGEPAVVRGGDVLPGFRLELSRINNAISPARFFKTDNVFKSDLLFAGKRCILGQSIHMPEMRQNLFCEV
jgi:Uma2 family endonuclease